MKLQGKIYKISEEQVISDKFKKREFILHDDSSQFPQYLGIQTTQERCSLLDKFNIGDNVEVSINLRGSKDLWTNKQGEEVAFVNIDAWKIEKAQAEEEGGELEILDNDNDPLPF